MGGLKGAEKRGRADRLTSDVAVSRQGVQHQHRAGVSLLQKLGREEGD